MADDAQTTTTPADDGRARVTSKGTVDTGGRRAFVWVTDESTGHRYDVPARRLPVKGLRVVEGYPLNFKTFGRPAKTRQEWSADADEPGGDDQAAVDQRAVELQAPGDEQLTPVADQPAPEDQAAGDAAAATDDQPAAGDTTTRKGRAR